MNSPIIWYGGKGMLKHKIIPFLPEHKTYVEVFGGGASILFTKPASKIEVYNDLDSGLFNFFMVISDPAKFKLFYEQVYLLPHSRELYYHCLENWDKEEDEIKKAAYWFVAARQCFSGAFGAGWSFAVNKNKTSPWLFTIKGLPEVHSRLQKVQIENKDWSYIIDTYDTKDTLFYLDPPYVLSTREGGKRYKHEMEEVEHKKLVERIQNIKGQFALSGYDNDIYNKLNKYEKHQFEVSCISEKKKDGGQRSKRIETLWIKRHTKNTLF